MSLDTSKYKDMKFATRILHVGQEPDAVTGAVTVPISMASTFAQKSPGVPTGQDSHLSYFEGYEYQRTGNPTRGAFEQALAAAEGAKWCVAFSSGMAATSAIMHTLDKGDHIVSIDDVYGGTQRYFRRVVGPLADIKFDFVDFNTEGELAGALKPEKTKLVWVESPTNPTLKVSDIAKAAEEAHKAGAMLVVDNTFMSPALQNPFELGADIVLHSITKFINGHSDVVMGAVLTNSDEVRAKLRFIQNGIGATPSPFDCYLALRGLKTLHLRMAQHSKNALAIAELLESRTDIVEKVLYPGLPSHPDHATHRKQTKGDGAMITFYVRGGIDAARAFLETVDLFVLAESLGAVESLCESPAIMTHASVPKEMREKLGISDSLIRLSVGVEDIDDLKRDIEKALAAAAAAAGGAGGAGG
eukprot:CAMPEP_0203826034 /NCGR_PEP_ID=MMETSP0115-20131106/55713_1 /ASSEMBLY_ACC=CAM_ASM_000227 /TAXON_ID=33651 /ORGANISM="Bicosoecid sp, Strain ms1" /LENGTH=415 /DNA_ID=CAMNT_0050735077 /DNA_START=56 /DNA_END=1299 /DNA_ORIENTATION=-